MTFCRQADGQGTTHITDVDAKNPQEAARLGKAECLENWEWEDRPDDVFCVGVIRTADCQVRLWDDENDLADLEVPAAPGDRPVTRIELSTRTKGQKLKTWPYKKTEKGSGPEGMKVTQKEEGGYKFPEFTFPELAPQLVRSAYGAPVVADIGGRRWQITVKTDNGSRGYPTHAEAIFEPSDEPLTEPDTGACRGNYSYWFGQPNFIQGTFCPHYNGKSAFLLQVRESQWGDCGNENVFIALDEDNFPCGIYLEASCC